MARNGSARTGSAAATRSPAAGAAMPATPAGATTSAAAGPPAAGAAMPAPAAWADVRSRLHDRGMRWTPQRRLLVEVLAATEGHITGAELVDRCRAVDPATTPSTVYRTLDVLEELGLIRHAHGMDGREEYHVLPDAEHGHLHCEGCGASWDLTADDAAGLVASLRERLGFRAELGHLTVVGRCRECAGG